MVSGHFKLTDNEVHNLHEADLNEDHQNKRMMFEVNKNGNDIIVVKQEDHKMKTNATIANNYGATLDEFVKVKIVFTNSYIGKMPEPSSLMFLINPSTTNVGQLSLGASENTSAMVNMLVYYFFGVYQRMYY